MAKENWDKGHLKRHFRGRVTAVVLISGERTDGSGYRVVGLRSRWARADLLATEGLDIDTEFFHLVIKRPLRHLQ
jgi:hypothetical protein